MESGFESRIKCPVCGKRFTVQTIEHKREWGYRIGAKFFCSYGCLRKFEKARCSKVDGMNLGMFADELFDAGLAKDKVKFRVRGMKRKFEDDGSEICVDIDECGSLYEISRKDGETIITIEF